MPDEETVVEIDLDILHWTVKETRQYRACVGVNPEYAIGALKVAADESAAEAKRLYGETDPPEDWMPLALLNIDPAYLLGFAWMAARRKAPALTFEAYSGEIETGDLMAAFYGVAGEAPVEAPLEAPTPLKTRKSSAPTSCSDSASSTAGA